jgi:hypothetical protein
MSIKSINEPEGPGRTTMVLPASINEAPSLDGLPPDAIPTPNIVALSPNNATLGDPSFTMYITGTNLFAQSVIVFAGQNEPTTLNTDGTLSTGINMDVWHGPDTVQVSVKNGSKSSNELPFTFAEAATRSAHKQRRER